MEICKVGSEKLCSTCDINDGYVDIHAAIFLIWFFLHQKNKWKPIVYYVVNNQEGNIPARGISHSGKQSILPGKDKGLSPEDATYDM